VTVVRKVGEGMAVQREWDLCTLSYFRFISSIWVCAKCGNDHALFVLGLVKSQPLSLFFPNYLALLSMYLMLIFCRRISTDGEKSDQAVGVKTDGNSRKNISPIFTFTFFSRTETKTGMKTDGT
jgi:hypothetical protein